MPLVPRSTLTRLVTACALVWGMAILTGCGMSPPSDESGAVADHEGMSGEEGQVSDLSVGAQAPQISVRDVRIPGPAAGVAGADGGVINRLGATEVPVRIYEAVDQRTAHWATLVWAHGGSFVLGTLDWPEADWVARRFAEHGVRVISVDYSLASDVVKAPAPANDIAAMLRYAAETFADPLVVGGASAGANLAVQAALTHGDFAVGSSAARPVDAVALLYPTLHRAQRADAAIAALTEGLPEQRRFRADRIAEMYTFYLGEGGPGAGTTVNGYPRDPLVVGEAAASRLGLLPPVVIVNAEADELRASGEQFAEQLGAAGVPVSMSIQPGTVHGYINRPGESSANQAASVATIERFVDELRRILTVA